MSEYLVNLAYDILAIILPVLAAGLVELIRRKLGVEKMQRIQKELETKQELAALAVRFAEQAYREYHGPEKYNAAAQWLAYRATEHGIKLTPEEIKGLIEAALRMIKDEFGEEWANIANQEA